ncbi:MAG TPA: aminotransferase class V-fold PLP-dependent enzyme [Kofleriaceae bacterium]|jgi:selenocysteine lyase/cysteine desulfurase|nr:aminotransferase class V-fold PLP-dependent enzyme [Kofleriaceae bacterium]
MTTDRRSFLASIGASVAAGVVWNGCTAPAVATPTGRHAFRGLVPTDDLLIDPALAYLQTGSLGPTPRPVLDRTIAIWRELERDPTALGYGPLEQGMETVRAKAAALLGCGLHELVITTSTTEGMNWVVQGVPLVAGDRILTTDQEHPGGRVGWDFVAKRYGAVIDVVKIPLDEHDAAAIVARFANSITPQTRVLSFSHVLTSTGLRMPVAELAALAKQAGAISVVDGAQAVGGIAVDVKQLGCDVYATSGHKWLLGPKGTGLLYLNDALGDRIEVIALQDGRAVYSHSVGVCSIPSVHGLGAAIDYIAALGIARVEAHNIALHRYAYDALAKLAPLRVVSARDGALASPLLTYSVPAQVDAWALSGKLHDKHHVEVKGVPREWLNGHRISTHVFNDERDIDRLVAALRSELA